MFPWDRLGKQVPCVRGVSTGIVVERWGWITGRGKMFLFSMMSRPVLGPTQPPIQCVPGALSGGMKTLANYYYFLITINFSSSFISYRIPSKAGYFG
jgi:hypothetical protein